ncbi:MAG: hypothetical protein ACW98I_09520 [Candidatus Hodarchaeales archaeon]|jgi:putative flippase GtrA
MSRKELRKFLLVGLLSLIIGVGCIYLGTEIFDPDMLILVIFGILLSVLGLFFLLLFIAPGTVLKILRQR